MIEWEDISTYPYLAAFQIRCASQALQKIKAREEKEKTREGC